MDYTNKDSLIMTGSLDIILVDANGELKDKRSVKNLILTVGKNYIANRMKETGRTTEMSHMAIGTSTTAAAVGDNNLGGSGSIASELARNPLATAGGTVVNNVVTYSATFLPTVGTGAITEAGIFNYGTATASPSGSQYMLCRTVFLVVNKAAADTLTINWNVTVN